MNKKNILIIALVAIIVYLIYKNQSKTAPMPQATLINPQAITQPAVPVTPANN